MTDSFSSRLENQAVRDLAWVMEGPALLDSTFAAWGGRVVTDEECGLLFEAGKQALAQLDQNPEPLHDFIRANRKTRRLGNYFEALLYYWLREILKYPHLEAGVIIQGEVETLGELDFVFTDPVGGENHWEAAVKFYMCIAESESQARDPAQYVGQRLLDRLDLKTKRGFERQLMLSENPHARKKLLELGFHSPKPRVFMKGRLFYPVSWNWEKHPGPEGISPRHLRGWWSAFSPEGLALPEGDSVRWILQTKEKWLAPASVPESDTLDKSTLIAALMTRFTETTDAIQVAALSRDSSGLWSEVSRGMILRPGWPDTAQEPAPT